MPSPLDRLIDRFDPTVFDVGRRRARLRIEGAGRQPRDVIVEDGRARVATPDGHFDAQLSADRETWEAFAEDLRGGLAAFRLGRHDLLVPLAFARHVPEVLPAARHLELDCGHVPQLERPRETHQAIAQFLGADRLDDRP